MVCPFTGVLCGSNYAFLLRACDLFQRLFIVNYPPLTALRWPCTFCFILSAPSFYSADILFIIPSTLSPLPLHLRIYSSVLFTLAAWFLSSLSLIPPHPPANFPTVPFPTSSFLSISPLIYLPCWAPTRSDALPLCLCYMCVICIPLPAIVKLIALWKAPLAPPKPLTMLAVTEARPLKITLHWASSLSAGLFPADAVNAAYYHCSPMLFSSCLFFHSILSFYLKLQSVM